MKCASKTLQLQGDAEPQMSHQLAIGKVENCSRKSFRSRFQSIRVLFNHGVYEDFAGNSLHLQLRFRQGKRVAEGQDEILALADIFNTAILHLS
jgi:hypothetical protein